MPCTCVRICGSIAKALALHHSKAAATKDVGGDGDNQTTLTAEIAETAEDFFVFCQIVSALSAISAVVSYFSL